HRVEDRYRHSPMPHAATSLKSCKRVIDAQCVLMSPEPGRYPSSSGHCVKCLEKMRVDRGALSAFVRLADGRKRRKQLVMREEYCTTTELLKPCTVPFELVVLDTRDRFRYCERAIVMEPRIQREELPLLVGAAQAEETRRLP